MSTGQMFRRRPRAGVVALTALVALAGAALWIPTAGATTPPNVTPVVERVCQNGSTITTTWGYVNTGGPGHIEGDDGDDVGWPPDGDNDDNIFSQPPYQYNQPVNFVSGTVHNAVITTSPSPITWAIGEHGTATATGPVDCADVAVTGALTTPPNPHQDLFDPSTVSTGNQYSVVVTTSPDSSAANAVVLTDTPSGGLVPGAAPAGCTLASGSYTCALGTLAPGSSTTFTFSVTNPGSATTATNTAIVASTTFDPNTANNTSVESTQIVAGGGTTSAGIINAGQSLNVTGTGTSGTAELQSGTLPLSLDISSTCPPGATCKSQVLNIVPTGGTAGQIIKGKFDTGRPSPFVFLPFVKFFYEKNGVDQRLPLCPRDLIPKPQRGGPDLRVLPLGRVGTVT